MKRNKHVSNGLTCRIISAVLAGFLNINAAFSAPKNINHYVGQWEYGETSIIFNESRFGISIFELHCSEISPFSYKILYADITLSYQAAIAILRPIQGHEFLFGNVNVFIGESTHFGENSHPTGMQLEIQSINVLKGEVADQGFSLKARVIVSSASPETGSPDFRRRNELMNAIFRSNNLFIYFISDDNELYHYDIGPPISRSAGAAFFRSCEQ